MCPLALILPGLRHHQDEEESTSPHLCFLHLCSVLYSLPDVPQDSVLLPPLSTLRWSRSFRTHHLVFASELFKKSFNDRTFFPFIWPDLISFFISQWSPGFVPVSLALASGVNSTSASTPAHHPQHHPHPPNAPSPPDFHGCNGQTDVYGSAGCGLSGLIQSKISCTLPTTMKAPVPMLSPPVSSCHREHYPNNRNRSY